MAALDDEERRLIDEAVAAGRVQKVPPGTSGYPEMRYDPKVRQITYVNPAEAKARLRASNSTRMRRGAPRSPQVAARRARVREHYDFEKGLPENATDLGISVSTLQRDLRAMGINLAERREAARKAMLETALEMARQGVPFREIASTTRLSQGAVSHYCREHGIRAPGRDKRTKERIERRKKVADLHRAGIAVREIAERVGAALNTVRKDIRVTNRERAEA